MALLDERDMRLSMKISPRSPRDDRNHGLRSLLLHRFTDGPKAVLRRTLETNRLSVYCEPCQQWTRVRHVGADWRCPRCARHYETELVVYAIRRDASPPAAEPAEVEELAVGTPPPGKSTDVTFIS